MKKRKRNDRIITRKDQLADINRTRELCGLPPIKDLPIRNTIRKKTKKEFNWTDTPYVHKKET